MENVAAPTPGPRDVILRVEVAGICGSDLHGYRGLNGRRRPGTVMGHELSGTVEQVGPEVDRSWLGRGVTVNPILGCDHCPACRSGNPQRCPSKALLGCVPEHPGAFAELVCVPASALLAWTGSGPLSWAAFTEPLAVGVHATRAVSVSDADVLVIGSGPIGIASALSARRQGARVTITVGDDLRRAVVLELGLSPVARDAVPFEAEYDVVVDCVGTDESLALAMAHTRVAGTVVVVGIAGAVAALPMGPLVQGERVVRGSAQYSRASFADAAAWLSSSELDVSALLGVPQPLSHAPEIFATWTDDPGRPVRSLLTPR
ncbi:MAG: alcohol dehydrogenase catalytic domain-containing protein [Propionibacteriaceae bacterium]